jgi:hypothetical protein
VIRENYVYLTVEIIFLNKPIVTCRFDYAIVLLTLYVTLYYTLDPRVCQYYPKVAKNLACFLLLLLLLFAIICIQESNYVMVIYIYL